MKHARMFPVARPKIPAIPALASAVFDNGRRGMPRPGCDCEQCFGYCHMDREQAARKGFGRAPAQGGDGE